MNKKKMPVQFRVLAAALALGFASMILSFADAHMSSFTLPFSQSPALLAVCLTMLSFYGEGKSGKVFSAASVLLAVYFAFIFAVGEWTAVLPLAACAALTLCAAGDFTNARSSKVAALCGVAASLVTAASAAVRGILGMAHGTGEAYLGGLIASRVPYIGYIAFTLVPLLFFAAVLLHVSQSKK